MHDPPEDTRAYFRGRCLEKFASAGGRRVVGLGDLRPPRPGVAAAGPDRPLRGSKAHVGELIDRSDTAEALVAELTR